MDNLNGILDIAYNLNEECTSPEHCFEQFKNCGKYVETENDIVTALAMCANKALRLYIDHNNDVSDAEFPAVLNAGIDMLTKSLADIIPDIAKESDESEEFESYLNKILKAVYSGARYVDKLYEDGDHLTNYYNEGWTRENRVSDNFYFSFVKDEKIRDFTFKKHIELPFLYVYANEIVYYCDGIKGGINKIEAKNAFTNETENSSDYAVRLSEKIGYCLSNLKNDTISIFIEGGCSDKRKNGKQVIFGVGLDVYEYLFVSFKKLLPVFEELKKDDRDGIERRRRELGGDYLYGHFVKKDKENARQRLLIKKESLERIPLLPVLQCGDWHISKKNMEICTQTLKGAYEQKVELRKKNEKLEKLLAERKESLNYYMHSWKHMAYPKIVHDIAKELLGTNKSMAARLMKAYNSEATLKSELEMLKYMHSDDEKEMNKAFRKEMGLSGRDSQDYITVNNVLESALDMVVFKLLFAESDDSMRYKKCREKWNLAADLNKLEEDYLENFMEKTSEDGVLDWVKSKFAEITVNKNSDWDSVRFKKDESFAQNQIKLILAEIFTNYFTHGQGRLQLDFDSTEDEMLIIAGNKCGNSITGSQKGLETMEALITHLNANGKQSVFSGTDNGKYRLELHFEKGLFIKIPR